MLYMQEKEGEQKMNEKYRFDNLNGKFTIDNPNTGKYWYNHLWNSDGYHMSVSHTGHGMSRYIDDTAKQVVLNLNEERYLYIRDEKSFKYWNIGISPSLNEVKDYRCEHGQGFTKISSNYDGIESSILFVVPKKGTNELWKVAIKNNSGVTRKLSVFPLLCFDLGGYEMPGYYETGITTETVFVEKMNGILCLSKNPFQPHERCSGFLASSEKVAYYDGWLEKFIGTIGSYTKPHVLENKGNCTNSAVTVRKRGAVLQNIIELAPGEERCIYYVAGFSTDVKTAIAECENALIKAEDVCKSAEQIGINKFGTLRTTTPNTRINNIMNFWVQKQVSFCMIGKKAVRDNAQIAMAMLNFNSELAEKTLYECLNHQYSDGHAALTWSPFLDPRVYSDQPMWLILAVCELIKETGDVDFLDKVIPYLDQGKDTVLEHLKCGVKWFCADENIGPNGFPKIHYADWNDALNIDDENGESIFMAMGVCLALEEFAKLSLHINDREYADNLLEIKDKLAKIINEKAWNGDYYVRAICKYGIIGDKTNEDGGKIYVNPQSWAILADVVPDDRKSKVFNAIDSMENEYGIPLCSPPYTKYSPVVGRMSGMLPGVYENGGIYNHACGFKIMADCKEGRNINAINSLLKMIPDGDENPSSITTSEPYVFTNCYLMHPSVKLIVGSSWQTGTSAWALRAYYEGILGLTRSYKGLIINPVLPNEWKEVSVTRKYRGCNYNIEFTNNRGNAPDITVDGEKIEGNLLPLFNDNKIHQVVVII